MACCLMNEAEVVPKNVNAVVAKTKTQGTILGRRRTSTAECLKETRQT